MLKLIYAPDPILKKESVSIPQVDDHHRELIKQMYEIMYSANGVGLAAPQIGSVSYTHLTLPTNREV